MDSLAPEYVAARRVLLDALAALEPHLGSIVLVGAQAVYLHTGDADLNVPLMTTDADLALDTQQLADDPEIGGALRAAGFTAGQNPGHWIGAGDIAVDVMVVPHQAGRTGTSARAAHLTSHDRHTARIARGLEPSLIDNSMAVLAALEAGDRRTYAVRVAGPAALLAAKAIKISERLAQADSQPDRLKQKDALDAFRILQAIDTADLVLGFAKHSVEDHAADVTAAAIEIYRLHATSPNGRIAQLAANAIPGDPTIAPAMAELVRIQLEELDGAGKSR